MSDRPSTPLLDTVETPADIRKLGKDQLRRLADANVANDHHPDCACTTAFS